VICYGPWLYARCRIELGAYVRHTVDLPTARPPADVVMMVSLCPATSKERTRVSYAEATSGDVDAHPQEDACLRARRNARSRLDLA